MCFKKGTFVFQSCWPGEFGNKKSTCCFKIRQVFFYKKLKCKANVLYVCNKAKNFNQKNILILYMTISEQAKKQRKAIGMRVEEFRKQLKDHGILISRMQIYNWDSGRTVIDYEYHRAIESILKFKFDYEIINQVLN